MANNSIFIVALLSSNLKNDYGLVQCDTLWFPKRRLHWKLTRALLKNLRPSNCRGLEIYFCFWLGAIKPSMKPFHKQGYYLSK